MNRKRMLRRTVAGMLAVLVVSGNILLPSQTVKLVADNAIVADASYVTKGNYTWDSSTGTLTITGTVNLENDPDNDVNEELTACDSATHHTWGDYYTFNGEVDKTKVKHLVIASTAVLPENCQAMFQGYSNLEDVVFAEYVDGTNVRKMSAMFKECAKLKSVDMSGLINTQNLEYIDNIFEGCSSLESLDISNIDGSKICQGRWTAAGAVHPAIDAIKEAIKNCDDLTDFEISSEFLDHCVINAQNNPYNSENQNVTIENVLDSLLSGNPNREAFKAKLLAQYNEWKDSLRLDIRECTVIGADNKEYDGQPLSISVEGLTEGVDYTVTLKLEGLTEITAADTKNAGIYSCTIEGIGNYKEKITKNIEVSQRVAELHWGVSSFYKDGEEHCPTVEIGNLVEGDTCELTVTGASKEAGPHTAKVTALSNPNYALPSNASHQFSIVERQLTGISATGYEGTYDQAAHGITVNKGNNNNVTITYSLDENDISSFTPAQPELIHAGEYTVYYRVTKRNYADFIGSATVKINPAEAGVEWDDVTTFAYNGSAQAPAATATGLLEGDTSDVVIEGAEINAGNYTATATGFTNTDYVLPTASTKDFEITAIDMEGIVAHDYSGEYDGQPHTITVDAPTGATVTYSETEDGEYTAEAPSLTDAGTKTVYYKVTNAPNYKDASGSADIEITAKAIGIQWGETEFDYDGETHCPTAEATDLIGDDECIVSVSGAASDAGTHTATASIDNTNYVLTGDLTTEFTIKAADMTVTAEDVTFTYDNQPHTITVNAPEGATILYSETEDGILQGKQG